jgi:chromosome segregation ATPase
MTLQEKETEIRELRERDEELKRQHASHVETLNGYNSELQSILERLGDIEQEITSATQTKGAKVALLDQLRREISVLTGQIKDPDSNRAQQIAEKRKILDGLEKGLQIISRDLESKQKEFKDVSETLVRLEQETQEIIQDTGNILGQIDQIKSDIQKYESEELMLQDKTNLTIELRTIRASIESKNTELQRLLRETQHVENELAVKLSTIDKTEITNNGLEKLLRTIDEDIEKKKNSMKRMEASKKRMKEENRANKEKQTKTAERLDRLDKEIKLVRENIGKKTKQNLKLQTQIDENELRYASLVDTYDSKQSILENLTKHLNLTRDQHDDEMKKLNRERQTLVDRISSLEKEKISLGQLLKTNEQALQTDIDKMKSIIEEKDKELDLLNQRKLSKKRKIEETRERITEKQIILDESMYDSVKRMVRDIDFKKHSQTAVLLFIFVTFVILTYVYGQKIYDFFDSRANIKNREEIRLFKKTHYLGVYEYLEKDKLVSQLLKDNPVYLNALVFFTPLGRERSRQDILKAYMLYGKN